MSLRGFAKAEAIS